MDSPGQSSYRQRSSSNDASYNSPHNMTTSNRAALVDSLYEALGRLKDKDEIEKTLEISDDNVDFAFEILINAPPSTDQREQKKIIEDHEFLGGIYDRAVQDDIREIIKVLPLQSSRHILEMYYHCGKNKDETISRICDDHAIPVGKPGKETSVKTEDMGKGKGREIMTEGMAIKSEPAQDAFDKYNPFTTTPRRLRDSSSSESDGRPPRFTPSSSTSSSQSPRDAIALRLGAPWRFSDLADRPEVPDKEIKTNNDNDGYDGEGVESDVDMLPAKDEVADEDEDIYDLPAKIEFADSDSNSDEGVDASSDPDEDAESNASGTIQNSSERDDDGDVDMSSETSNMEEEPKIELTNEEKEARLKEMFPGATINEIQTDLTLNNGDIDLAAEDLLEQFGSGGSEADEEERSPSPGVGSSRPKKLESHKRRAAAFAEDRQIKRVRCGEDMHDAEETHELDSADKWMIKLLHSDTGIQIGLDSGVHPCRITENVLSHVPGFQNWLQANPARIGVDRTMKVPDVSLETFNLAMQWAVCSTGQLTPNQRRSKTTEITAFIDLAIFATTVNLSLGKASGSYMTKLKTILVKHQTALTGSHIRKAFEKLEHGHQVRNLFILASIRPYAEFHTSSRNFDMAVDSGSESGSDDDDLNPAQRAAYRKARFCFHSEFNKLEEYQSQLLKEFHRVWWTRNSRDKKYSYLHFCHETFLTDPLTNERFQV
ncbi:hypothetical protein VTL71DRAFT_3969 [Oculimacula yallundae]|uniref:CUE domain-containing protein n=1 Tax=Oculimacula yallundae TaxID=86028 RepID=A0ABR4C4J1_9HELO